MTAELEVAPIHYAEKQDVWQTPNGRPIAFLYRDQTNDWNTLSACLGDNDEYLLKGRSIDGWAVDIGGYLGSVGVTIAVDNPWAKVLIVEPVPDNADLIRRNADMNGVSLRVQVYEGAAGPPGVTTSQVHYRYSGSESLEHHAFVGNASLAPDEAARVIRTVETLGLGELLDRYDIDEPSFLKIDCEGGEWSFLDCPDVSRLPYIIGEVHNTHGHSPTDILPLLPGHDVAFHGPNQETGPCGFTAVRR